MIKKYSRALDSFRQNSLFLRRSSYWCTVISISLLASCNGIPSEDFKIVLPDVSFLVKRAWVPPNERFNGGHFNIAIPYIFLPKEVEKIDTEREIEEYGKSFGARNHHNFYVRYTDAPMPGWRFKYNLINPGWTVLPSSEEGEFIAAIRYEGPAGNELHEIFELKADRRYSIGCFTINNISLTAKPAFSRCSMSLPYKECTGERCTMFSISFRRDELKSWRERGEFWRSVLRKFEIEPVINKQ